MYYEVREYREEDNLPILPDILFNRPDRKGADYLDLVVSDGQEKIYRIMVALSRRKALAGVYLREIPEEACRSLAHYLFRRYRNIWFVEFRGSGCAFGRALYTPQRIVSLGDCSEDIHLRMNSKSRYNIRREKRIVRENLGEYHIKHFAPPPPPDYVRTFLEYKAVSHRIKKRVAEEYIGDAGITDIYALETFGKILAVALSCEQCDMTYFENFSYLPGYERYSLGSIMYDHYIEELSKKGVKSVSLGNGWYDYKKRYNSHEVKAYKCTVCRWRIITMLMGWCTKLYEGMRKRDFNK